MVSPRLECWYIGPSPQHYRNYNIFVTSTRTPRNSDTVVLFPTTFNMPETSSADRATAAVEDLIHELKHPKPTAPFLGLNRGTPTNSALRKLEEFFKNRAKHQETNQDQEPNQDQQATNIANRTRSATTRAAQSTAQASPRVSESAQAPPRVNNRIPRVANPTTRPNTRSQSTHPNTRSAAKKQDQEARTTFSNYTGGYGNALQAILYKE